MAAFTQETLRSRYGEGNPTEVPVFVVGMPRSGTTLVEQILASHPDVFGAGELPDIPSIVDTLPRYAPNQMRYPGCLAFLGPPVIRGFADAYLKRVRTLDATSERVVDKWPLNYLHLGLMALLFPRARIVHCRRDPLDTCLSCYFQRFRGDHEYSYDLAHLGSYYRTYERLISHWREVLPMPVLELHYEALIDDPQATSERLLAFCGLSWQERCLRFHESPRPVSTASNWQVRHPLYRSAVQRWRNYEAHLGPLRDALSG
ncbi:MAG: sulfotransferase [Planctomycetes bacterium]|nr:sulfotransferase [Planctomycetota bacterium]